MISLLQRAEIRRFFYAEHWPIGTIADALGVHHETVCRSSMNACGETSPATGAPSMPIRGEFLG
jgi:hypothetical protein